MAIPLLERISGPSGLAHTPSPQSSMSGFEGAVSRYEDASTSPSPTPSEIEADLTRFPPSPADSEVVRTQIIEATTPPPDQINGTIALCKAILRYRQAHPELSEFMEACTGDLMISITAMSNADVNRPLPITNGEYNRIVHLTYVSAFTDKIEPYLEDAVQEIGPPPTLLQRISTPSHISVTDSEDETDHPGQDWIRYDATNPKHYPLVFINEENEEEVAKYIRYHNIGDGVHLQGRRSKDSPLYAIPLHARAYSVANFFRAGVKDTELAIFHPSATSRITIDNALFHLGDPGIIADIHTLRAQHLRLMQIKRQRLELDLQERKAEEEKLTAERYLAHAAVRTRLLPYLVLTRPRSPPTRIIPRIHAAQGPMDCDPEDCEGKDSLECRQVKKPRTPPGSILGKRKERLPPFPYCLKCHSEDPGHLSDECPYSRTCRWCWSTYHSHSECPSPHLACSTTKCVVPLNHINMGTVCSTSLLAGDDSYESRLAAGDYDGDLEGFTTD